MMVNLSWEKVAYVLAVEIEKWDHQEGHKFIRCRPLALLKHSRTFMEAPRYPKRRTFVHQFRGGGAFMSMTLWQSAICWRSQSPLLTKPWTFIYLQSEKLKNSVNIEKYAIKQHKGPSVLSRFWWPRVEISQIKIPPDLYWQSLSSADWFIPLG